MTPVICTVDVVLLTLKGERLHVALLKRDKPPFVGLRALPGGYVHADDDKDAQGAAMRVLREKANVESPYLEQLATFSGPTRDPRGWSISIAYYALVSAEVLEAKASDALQLVAIDELNRLPFDHHKIIDAAVQRVRNKSVYSSLPVYLAPASFTLPQLQAVYEAVMGEPIDRGSFRRKMLAEGGFIEETGESCQGKPGRPGTMYRLKPEYRHGLTILERGFNVS